MILYHESNLVYTVVFPQFLIFQQNSSVQTSVLILFTSRHYYFFEKLKIVEKQLYKLNCSYGKVSHKVNIPYHYLVIFDFTKFVGLFEMNNFTSQHFFVSRIVCPENGFFNFLKTAFDG